MVEVIIFSVFGLGALVFALLWVRSSKVAQDYRIEAQNLAHDKVQIRHTLSRAIEVINIGRAKEARSMLVELIPTEFRGVCGGCEKARVMNYEFCPECGKRVPRSSASLLIPKHVPVEVKPLPTPKR